MEAQIRNVWPGFKRECCTSADNCTLIATTPTISGKRRRTGEPWPLWRWGGPRGTAEAVSDLT